MKQAGLERGRLPGVREGERYAPDAENAAALRS